LQQDLEAKRAAERKDPAGPPLQTASVSVRALIEEKIIQKRCGAVAGIAGVGSVNGATSARAALLATTRADSGAAGCPPSLTSTTATSMGGMPNVIIRRTKVLCVRPVGMHVVQSKVGRGIKIHEGT